MYPAATPSEQLRQAARSQGGVLTRAQATALGFDRHLQQRFVSAGRWQRLAPGVLLTHDQPPSWESLAWAGVLHGGASARLGGLAAAYAHGLSVDEPDRLLIWLPHGTRRTSPGPWTYRGERPGVRRSDLRGEPPRTCLDDTVVDLCDASLGETERSAQHWITLAIGQRRTTAERLRHTIEARSRFSHRREVMELLVDVADGSMSPLELRYLRDVERAHGLPRGERQVAGAVRGARVYRDIVYRDYSTVVELDGHAGRVGMARFRDHRRDNAVIVAGGVNLRYGWVDVTQAACGVAREVAAVLIERGWGGALRSCARCRDSGAILSA